MARIMRARLKILEISFNMGHLTKEIVLRLKEKFWKDNSLSFRGERLIVDCIGGTGQTVYVAVLKRRK